MYSLILLSTPPSAVKVFTAQQETVARFLIWRFGKLGKEITKLKTRQSKLNACVPMILSNQITKFKFHQHQQRAISPNLMLIKLTHHTVCAMASKYMQVNPSIPKNIHCQSFYYIHVLFVCVPEEISLVLHVCHELVMEEHCSIEKITNITHYNDDEQAVDLPLAQVERHNRIPLPQSRW